MNNKIIQNINGKATANTTFRGKAVVLKPKHSMTLDVDDEEQLSLYRHLLSTFSFVIDRTAIYKKDSEPVEPVKVKQGFYQKLVAYIQENMPDVVGHITYSDDEISIKFKRNK